MTAEGQIQISAQIEQSLRDELAELAKEGERSFAAEVRRALRMWVLSQKKAA